MAVQRYWANSFSIAMVGCNGWLRWLMQWSVAMVGCNGWCNGRLQWLMQGWCNGWLQWLFAMVVCNGWCNGWLQWLIAMVDCNGWCNGWGAPVSQKYFGQKEVQYVPVPLSWHASINSGKCFRPKRGKYCTHIAARDLGMKTKNIVKSHTTAKRYWVK